MRKDKKKQFAEIGVSRGEESLTDFYVKLIY